MLSTILNSPQQFSIISFLITVPERSYSAGELARRLRLPQRKATMALGSLVKIGLITPFNKGRHKYYLLNRRQPLVMDLRQGLPKSSQQPDELFIAIKSLGTIRAAFLSGLFTGQTHLPVDLLLVGRVRLDRLEKFLKDCQKMIGQELNYSLMSAEEFLVRRDSSDRFVKDIFDHPYCVVVDRLGSPQPKTRLGRESRLRPNQFKVRYF